MCKSVKKYFDNHICFEIVGVAHDGVSGFKLLQDTPCDIALIDIIMPRKDGISILEELHANSEVSKPVCIMLTAVSHDGLTKKALELGADYFILKPFDSDVLARRMLDIYNLRQSSGGNHESDENPEDSPTPKEQPLNFAVDMLQKLGVPSNLNGYTYLKLAVVLAVEDPTMLNGITKVLYPTIAKRCDTTSVRVERSIRHAIEAAWQKGCEADFSDCLGYVSKKHEKPTNSHLISLMAEKYRFQYM